MAFANNIPSDKEEINMFLNQLSDELSQMNDLAKNFGKYIKIRKRLIIAYVGENIDINWTSDLGQVTKESCAQSEWLMLTNNTGISFNDQIKVFNKIVTLYVKENEPLQFMGKSAKMIVSLLIYLMGLLMFMT